MKASQREWFRRFGDIPGVDWATPFGIDRDQLRGHDAVPETSDSGRGDTFWWPLLYREDSEDTEVTDELDEGGSTTQSPAEQYPGWVVPRTVAEELQRLGEALELPGEPGAYHSIISQAADRLYKIRLREPVALREVERLCLLDLELLRTRPEILARGDDDGPRWVEVVRRLHRLYSDAGDLRDAESVAVVAIEEFGQDFDRELTETRQRRELLEAEDG